MVWIAIVYTKGILPGWQDGRSDFSNYYAASRLLTKGDSISSFYNNEVFFKRSIDVGVAHGAKFSPFTPFTAYLFLPLTPFSELTAKRIWLIFNVLQLVILGLILKKRLHLSNQKMVFIGFIFLTPLLSNLRLGQVYLCFTLISAILVLDYRKSNKPWFEVGMTSMAAVKIFPIAFLLYRIKDKSLTRLIGLGTITLILLSAALVSHQGFEALTMYSSVFLNHLNGALSGQQLHSFYYQSMDSLLHYWFVFDAVHNPSPILDAPVLKSAFKWAYVLVILGLVSYLVYHSKPRYDDSAVSIAIFGLSLVFPATATYHYLLLVLPVSFLVFNEKFTSKNFRWLAFLSIAVSLNLSPFHIFNFNAYPPINAFAHHPRLLGLITAFIMLFVTEIKKEVFVD